MSHRLENQFIVSKKHPEMKGRAVYGAVSGDGRKEKLQYVFLRAETRDNSRSRIAAAVPAGARSGHAVYAECLPRRMTLKSSGSSGARQSRLPPK